MTIRLAPPLMVGEDDLDWALDRIEEVAASWSLPGRLQAYSGTS